MASNLKLSCQRELAQQFTLLFTAKYPTFHAVWRTLLRAARIQNHARVLQVTEDIPEGQIPSN